MADLEAKSGYYDGSIEARVRLRQLRLWHWFERERWASVERAAWFERERRRAHELVTLHIRAVQSLNDFFPVGDTAEADAQKWPKQ